MVLFLTLILIQINYSNKMNVKSIPYNNQLKKVELSDITFNNISLNEIPKLFYKDYSHHKSTIAKSHKSFDTMEFRNILLKQLSNKLGNTIFKLIIISPKNKNSNYDAFAYLSSKDIVSIHFENIGNFKLWMDVIFKKQYQKLEEYKGNNSFEKQPKFNPNVQF